MAFVLNDKRATSHFERILKQHDAEIDWPLRPHGSIQLKCTLTYSDPLFPKKSKVWPVASRKAFDQCMELLDHDEINTLQDVWSEVSVEGTQADFGALCCLQICG